MGEAINNYAKRKETLKALIRQLHEGATIEDVQGPFADVLRDVSAHEISEIEQDLIDEGMPETEIKRLCDVHVALFRESLDAKVEPGSTPGHPIHTLRAENAAAEQALRELEHALDALKVEPTEERKAEARARLERLQQYERHYLREENVLFSYLERHGFTGPSTVMWAIHDDVREGWRALDDLLAQRPGDDPLAFQERLDQILEPLSSALREMFYKEHKILFPTALEKLSETEWVAVREQGTEFGYAFVQPGDQWAPETTPPGSVDRDEAGEDLSGELLPLGIGALTLKEAQLLLAHLPIEITYVDEDDTVRFISPPEDHIFGRSPAVIGRKVQKCHPPASVHRVQQILDGFRADQRDMAEFWIEMNGRFIHIRYFAVRDAHRTYRGTLEVVQDVTHIRELQGERRLLDEWGEA
jgi:DUF438 domain-containing protein